MLLQAQNPEILKLNVTDEQYNKLSEASQETITILAKNFCDCHKEYATEVDAFVKASVAFEEARAKTDDKELLLPVYKELKKTMEPVHPFFSCISGQEGVSLMDKVGLSADLKELYPQYNEDDDAFILRERHVLYKVGKDCADKKAVENFEGISQFLMKMNRVTKERK